MRDRDLRRFLIITFIWNAGSATALPFFSYITVGKLGMSVWQIAATAVSNLGFGVLFQSIFGRMMDRVGRRPIIVFSRVAMAVSTLGYAFATSWLHIIAIEGLVGVATAAWSCGQSTYIIDIAPAKLRATYLAASVTAVGVSSFLGSYLMGTITQGFITSTNYSAISMVLVFTTVLRFAFGLLYLTIRESKPAA